MSKCGVCTRPTAAHIGALAFCGQCYVHMIGPVITRSTKRTADGEVPHEPSEFEERLESIQETLESLIEELSDMMDDQITSKYARKNVIPELRSEYNRLTDVMLADNVNIGGSIDRGSVMRVITDFLGEVVEMRNMILRQKRDPPDAIKTVFMQKFRLTFLSIEDMLIGSYVSARPAIAQLGELVSQYTFTWEQVEEIFPKAHKQVVQTIVDEYDLTKRVHPLILAHLPKLSIDGGAIDYEEQDGSLTLTSSISALTALESLEIDSVRFALPKTIGELTRLNEIKLVSMDLRSIPKSVGMLTRLTRLNLHWNALTDLPVQLGQLAALTDLDISGNRLVDFPTCVLQMTALVRLDMHNNKSMKSLPAEIGRLTRLTTLDLGYNDVTAVPEEIGRLTRLVELQLAGNNIGSLPSGVGKLSQLKTLTLAHNKLTEFPVPVLELRQLQKLTLGSNKLETLPEDIGYMLPDLIDLRVDDNLLTRLPDSILRLKIYRSNPRTYLSVTGNYLRSLPGDLAERGVYLGSQNGPR